MCMSIIDQIKDFFAGDPAKKTIQRYQDRVNEINKLEEAIQQLSDSDLAEKTNDFNFNIIPFIRVFLS